MTSPDRITEFDEEAPAPSETKTATVALGCFWGPDATFGAMDGVVRTRVGYAGGTYEDPTYHDLDDHSEVLQIDYDPEQLTFAEIVDVAIENHDPRRQPSKRQYQYILFYESAEERETIENRLESLRIGTVETRVEPLDSFTLAEDYHQKYNLRSKRALLNAFEETGYDAADIRESPAAAKLNAHVAGHDVREIAAVQ